MSLQQHRRQSVPLYADVADLFRRQIVDGKLAVGQQLPSLIKLTESFGISRVTARQAMDVLEAEGLIERGSGRGTFVLGKNHPPRGTLHLKADLDSLINLVEGGPSSFTSIEADVVDHVSDRPQSVGPYNRMKRVYTLDEVPFGIFEIFVHGDIYALAPERFDRERAIIQFPSLNVKIAKAHQSIQISATDMEVATLLKVPVNSPMFKVSREFRDESGNIIYAAFIMYRGDFLSLEIDFV